MIKLLRNWYVFVLGIGVCIYSGICWYNTFNIKETNEDTNTTEETDEENNQDISDLALFDLTLENSKSDFEDHIYDKSTFSEIDSVYTYYTTNTVSSTQVVLGNNGWLFYKTTTDGEPISDYEGTNTFTNDEMAAYLEHSLRLQNDLQSKEIQFAMVFAPNKENIYPQYMPEEYHHALMTRTDLLVEYMQKGGVNVISPKDDLLSYSDAYQLYYSYDTHWNQLGGYIGVNDILQSWNLETTPINQREISQFPLKGNYHYCGWDDLANILGMREAVFSDDIEYHIEGTSSIDWSKYEEEQNAGPCSHFENPEAKYDQSVFLIGDSFRSAMIPSLLENFKDVYVVHRYTYQEGMIDEITPDYVILEYVERYSYEIANIDMYK